MKPLDELKSLDHQIETVQELSGLKPIFFRLEEIAKANVNDFDVQLAVGDIKQHLVNRGTKLKEMKPPAPAAAGPSVAVPPIPTAPQPVPPPPAPYSREVIPEPTVAMPLPPLPTSAPSSAPPPSAAPPPLSPSPLPGSASAPPSPLSATGFNAMPTTALPVPPPPPPAPLPASGPLASETLLSGNNTALPASGPWATTEHSSASVPPPPIPPPAPLPATPPPPAKPPAGTAKTAAKPPQKPPAQKHWHKPVLAGGLIGLLIVLAAGAVLIHKRRQKAATATIQVQIATTPPGASIQVNGENQCVSNCSVALAPGNYQITAFLEGFEPAASGIAVGPGQPATVNLALEPQAQSLRIITDLDQGKVAIDGDPPADLQEGQYVLDRMLPGMHTVKVTGKSGEASFSFQVEDAKQPVITPPVTARNLDAVLVSSLGNHAHVLTSNGPLKLAVNGQAEEDTGPAGVDLKNFQAGVDELVLGDGKDQHSVKENFGPAPMLTAFLKSDLNAGTLIVSTGEDDVRVFINNKEYPRRTARGQIRIQTIGPVQVRVAKDGFDAPPVQTAEVKKGAETRLEFKLNATPRFATLQINGGTAGAQVTIDQSDVGTIGADGRLTDTNVTPGAHTIEIARDGFQTHRLTRNFQAGQTVAISGADSALTAVPAAPAPTVAKTVEPPPPPKKETPPPPQAGTMADWENPAAWKMENGVWLHQGAGFVPYKLPARGVFTFTVQLVKGGGFLHSGHIRWALNYKDPKNYAFFEMDNKNFWAKVMTNGKTFERTHTQLKDLEKQKSFTIQIDVTPEHVVHKMFSGGDWINLDSWAETGRNFSEGKFGFLFQGGEEVSLSDFKFAPK